MSYSGQLLFPCKKSYFTQVQDTTYNTGSWNDGVLGMNMIKNDNGGHEGVMTALIAAPSTPYSIIACLQWNGPMFNGTSIFSDPGPSEGRIGLCLANGITTSSLLKFHTIGNLNGSSQPS